MRMPALSVSTRLLLSFVGAVTFVVIASAVAVVSFDRMNSAMDNIATVHLPTMIASYQLAQQAEGTVASAPALVASTAQSQRRTAYLRVQDQLRRLEGLTDQLVELGRVPRETLLVIEQETQGLKTTFDRLDSAVSTRIDNNRARARLVSDASRYRQRLNGRAEEMGRPLAAALTGGRGSAEDYARLARVETVRAQLDLAIDTLIATAEAAHRFGIGSLRDQFEGAVERAVDSIGQAGPDDRARLMPLVAEIRDLADGGGDARNVFDARVDELAAEESIAGLLSRYSHTASRLVFSVTDLIFAAQENIRQARAESLEVSRVQSSVLIGLTFICVVGVVLVAVYVSRSIIARLEGLQHGMEAAAAGQPVIIDTEGDDEIGRMARAVGAFVSARDGAMRDLRRARDEADAANEAKTKFLAAASHDLRQPLQALNLFVTALGGRDDLPQASRHTVARIEESLEALSSLLDSLLDISKLDAGTVKPDKIAFPLAPLLQRLAAEFEPLTREQGLRFKVHACDVMAYSDPSLLERVLRNLLTNAVRYTDAGGLLLAARRRGRYVRIEVWDSGPGIPADKLELIFEEFHQLQNPHRDRARGLGLGLAIVRRTADLLGHEVTVDSVEGKGAVFRVSVPCHSAPAVVDGEGELASRAAPDLMGRTIIVIDDEEPIRDGMAMLLGARGATVITSDTAADAIRQARLAGGRIDLVICDYRLEHQTTGDEAVAMVRAALGVSIPGLLITGEIAPDELRQTQASGLPILHKPVAAPRLWEAIKGLIDARAS